MSNTSIAAKPLPDNPRIQREDRKVMLFGAWNLRGLAVELPRLRRRLKRYARQTGLEWDLSEVSALDSAGAFVLWQVWGERFPAHLRMSDEYVTVFDRWRKRQIPSVQDAPRQNHTRGENLKQRLQTFTGQITGLLILLGRLVFDVGYLISHPPDIPWREISATLYDVGVRALGITAMVGFLIGIVLSYLSALQLENYGAQAFAVNILGLGVIRELGPALAAVLVAGRSGSAMTAQLGVMRVTQELDALAAMGIPASQRLILPNVVALMIGLPLLVVWTDAMALMGGAIAAKWELDFGYYQFFTRLPDVVPVSNLTIGLGKGAVFGLCIGLIASHFGLRTQPNTQSLGRETTHSVVTSITLVILIDALFAVVFDDVGMP